MPGFLLLSFGMFQKRFFMANVNEIAAKYGHEVQQNDVVAKKVPGSINADAYKMAEQRRKDAENIARQILKLISSHKVLKTVNYAHAGDMGRVLDVVKNALGEISWLKK